MKDIETVLAIIKLGTCIVIPIICENCPVKSYRVSKYTCNPVDAAKSKMKTYTPEQIFEELL